MVLTIAAQKGGVSKTTTAAAIAQALSYRRKTALLVDCDPQGSATNNYGTEAGDKGGTYGLITGTAKADDLIVKTAAGDIIPSSPLLDRLNLELNNKPGRDTFLKAGLEPIRNRYDFILIDTPPGLGTLLIQALTACDSVIIPLLSDPQALQGLHQMAETIDQVRRYCNPSIKIACVVLTQYLGRAILTRQYEELITEHCKQMGVYLASTRIRKGISVQESQASRLSLYEYNPKSNPAIDYLSLCKELKLIKK